MLLVKLKHVRLPLDAPASCLQVTDSKVVLDVEAV
jgi:hypothetical protein